MSTISGLSKKEAFDAREMFIHGADLLLQHKEQVHYSEGADRWDAITRKVDYREHHFLHHGDCSSTGTWLWSVPLRLQHGLPDLLNGDNWEGGFTGTLAAHGHQLEHVRQLILGDAVLYGPAPTFSHVAWVVGWKNGVPLVFSHGSESGPVLAAYNYRPDVGMFRRYV